MMQSTISQRVSIGILLVPHRIIAFFKDDGKGKSMAHHRTFSMQSPPMPKFNAFIGAKYSFHTLGYLLRPATMKSPNRIVLGFAFLIIKQWFTMIFNQVRFIKMFCWS